MSNAPEIPNDAPNPTCRIVVSKDDAKLLSVDQPVTLKVTGKVKSLHAMYSDEAQYEVEIEDPHVENCDTDDEEKGPDEEDKENMATMSREELKKRLMSHREND